MEHRKAHVRILRLAQDVILETELLWHKTLDAAVADAFFVLQKTHQWMHSTAAKHAGTLLGAWPRLLQYTETTNMSNALCDWNLNRRPTWRDALRSISKAAKEESVKFPVAVSLSQVMRLLDALREPLPALHALCLLGWNSCARIGDAAQLHRDEVQLSVDGILNFHYRRGKGVSARGPYTVLSFIDPSSTDFIALKKFLSAAPTGRLFPAATTLEHKRWGILLRDELRKMDDKLQQRSFRRGSLQLMASNSAVDLATLLATYFSFGFS
jgi:integrase